MKKETAVDFLWTKASSGEHLTPEDFEQAKAIEREQIVNAYASDRYPCSDEDAEQYYNEVYKGGEQ